MDAIGTPITTALNCPPYMLYAYEKKPAKKFHCERCVETPDDFLKCVINRCLAGPNSNPETANTPRYESTEEKVAILEQRVCELSDLMEKFDLSKIADNLLAVGT